MSGVCLPPLSMRFRVSCELDSAPKKIILQPDSRIFRQVASEYNMRVSGRASAHHAIPRPLRPSAISTVRFSATKKLLSTNSTAFTPCCSLNHNISSTTAEALFPTHRLLYSAATAQKPQRKGHPKLEWYVIVFAPR